MKKAIVLSLGMILIACIIINAHGEQGANLHKIVFLGLFGNQESFQVWSILTDGTKLTQLTRMPLDVVNLFKLQGSRVAYQTFDTKIYVLDLDSGTSQYVLTGKLNETEGFEHALDISVSSGLERVAITRYTPRTGHMLEVLDIASGHVAYLSSTLQTQPSPLHWNASSPSVLYLRDENTIKKLEIDTEHVTQMLTIPQGMMVSYHLSANEHVLAVESFDEAISATQIVLYESEKPVAVIQHPASVKDPFVSSDGAFVLYVERADAPLQSLRQYTISTEQHHTILEGKGAIALPLFY